MTRDAQNFNVRLKKVGAILNTSSGSCDENVREEMETILREAGIITPHIWCGEANEMDEAFAQATDRELDILIILGGDGTIRTAAEICSEKGPILIPLPGGTMNMLPKALYGDVSWQDILRSILSVPVLRSVSCGQIEKKRFFVAAILGTPSLWAKARESVREGALGEAIEQSVSVLQQSFGKDISYELDAGEKKNAEALGIICPLISSVLADKERSLEVVIFNLEGPLEVLRLASRAVLGEWRDDPGVSSIKVKQATVSSEKEIPAILDGETILLGREAKILFVPVAFNSLVPQSEEGVEIGK
ncbi:NAD(+)/NADH kinase [Patescibacteria group bacterium]|nr:NAD(+)/NADH kinase [Patescibacteria group bacterium]